MGSYGIYNPGTQAMLPVDKPQAADGQNPATLIPLRMALHTFGPEAFELPPQDAASETAPPAKIGASVNLLDHSYIAPLTGAHVILVLQGDPAPDPYTTVVWLACGSDGRFKIWKTLGNLTTERLQESLPSDGYSVTLGQVFRIFWSLAPEPVDRMWAELEAAYKSLGPLPDKAALAQKLAPVTKSPLWSTIKIGLYYDAFDRFGYELWRATRVSHHSGRCRFCRTMNGSPTRRATSVLYPPGTRRRSSRSTSCVNRWAWVVLTRFRSCAAKRSCSRGNAKPSMSARCTLSPPGLGTRWSTLQNSSNGSFAVIAQTTRGHMCKWHACGALPLRLHPTK
jgi:hypothetical protein